MLLMSIRISVGNPIHVEKCDKPSIEEVKRVQNMYIDELLRYVTLQTPAFPSDAVDVEYGTHTRTSSLEQEDGN